MANTGRLIEIVEIDMLVDGRKTVVLFGFGNLLNSYWLSVIGKLV
jgi:hypothetical protein